MCILEVCASDLASAYEAAKGGAQRIELCADLALDGLTPPREWIEEARRIAGLKLHVLIRSRAGDFVYTDEEMTVMREQVRMAREAGADGVVIGALTPDGDIDVERLKPLMEEAHRLSSAGGCPMQVTFHRAFDVCRDPMQALEDIIALGCTRLLTSGQQPTALDGAPLIAELVKQADNRIIILPGAGVNPDNAAEILRKTGASEIHSSARSIAADGQKHTDAKVVASILQAINS